jgi:hypothetical protein
VQLYMVRVHELIKHTSDVVAIHVRAQNAAVVVRKQGKYTLFEQFEVQPPNAEIMGCTGKPSLFS